MAKNPIKELKYINKKYLSYTKGGRKRVKEEKREQGEMIDSSQTPSIITLKLNAIKTPD